MMNKEFAHKSYNFNISVDLDIRVERKMNGKRWHKVVINDMGFSNFYIEKEVEDDSLLDAIHGLENKAIEFVDKVDRDSASDVRLYDLGFR